MNPTAAWIAGLASLAALAAAPPALAAKPKSQCFYARDVNGFAAPDDRTVNLRVGVRDVYQMELFAPCPEIDWSTRIAVVSHGSSWICSGMDATLIAPSTIGPQRCQVRTLRKLTPAEAAALPKGARP